MQTTSYSSQILTRFQFLHTFSRNATVEFHQIRSLERFYSTRTDRQTGRQDEDNMRMEEQT
jgi:hypothetical protein